MKALRLGGIAALLLLATAGAAQAATITFNGLVGANGATFTTYNEAGFTVTKTAGSGCEAQIFGNPVPSVFGGPQCDQTSSATFTVVGGIFSFGSIDLAANNGTTFYEFIGTLGGGTVFNLSSSLAGPHATFVTILSPSGGAIDTLTMNFRTAGTSFNIDNITTSAVPEPATWSLLALGLAGVAMRLRRRV